MNKVEKEQAKAALVRWLKSQAISPPEAIEILNEVTIDIIQIMIARHEAKL